MDTGLVISATFVSVIRSAYLESAVALLVSVVVTPGQCHRLVARKVIDLFDEDPQIK